MPSRLPAAFRSLCSIILSHSSCKMLFVINFLPHMQFAPSRLRLQCVWVPSLVASALPLPACSSMMLSIHSFFCWQRALFNAAFQPEISPNFPRTTTCFSQPLHLLSPAHNSLLQIPFGGIQPGMLWWLAQCSDKRMLNGVRFNFPPCLGPTYLSSILSRTTILMLMQPLILSMHKSMTCHAPMQLQSCPGSHFASILSMLSRALMATKHT